MYHVICVMVQDICWLDSNRNTDSRHQKHKNKRTEIVVSLWNNMHTENSKEIEIPIHHFMLGNNIFNVIKRKASA